MKVTPQCLSGRMSMRCLHALAWGLWCPSHSQGPSGLLLHTWGRGGDSPGLLHAGSSEVTESSKGKWVWGREEAVFPKLCCGWVLRGDTQQPCTIPFSPLVPYNGTFQITHWPILVLLCHYGESELWRGDPYMNTHISQHTLGSSSPTLNHFYFRWTGLLRGETADLDSGGLQ